MNLIVMSFLLTICSWLFLKYASKKRSPLSVRLVIFTLLTLALVFLVLAEIAKLGIVMGLVYFGVSVLLAIMIEVMRKKIPELWS